MKIDLMGLDINTEDKKSALKILEHRIAQNAKTFITTVYSEFYWHAYKDNDFKKIINESDLALPDGISILWLSYYLSMGVKSKRYYLKFLEAVLQEIASLMAILFYPSKIKKIIPQKIPGSDFFWDVVAMAASSNLSIFLLGGYENTPAIVAQKIRSKYPQIKIAGYSNFSPKKWPFSTSENQQIVQEINNSKTDILLVAYGPVKQEKWIRENLERLNIKVAMGVGGTFDYIAEKKSQPPKFFRDIGLEWFYRLITQPGRFTRIRHATLDFIKGALRHKVFMTMPFRSNIAGVIINKDQKILVIGKKVRIGTEDSVREITAWQFPQGGVENNESNEEALMREMREEIGTQNLAIIGQMPDKFEYIWPHYIRPIIGNDLKYKGQSQHIYFLKYFGDSRDIKMESPDFDYKWVERSELNQIFDPVRKIQLGLILQQLPRYLNV